MRLNPSPLRGEKRRETAYLQEPSLQTRGRAQLCIGVLETGRSCCWFDPALGFQRRFARYRGCVPPSQTKLLLPLQVSVVGRGDAEPLSSRP